MENEAVCAICLTADRQRLTTRAISCFVEQTAPAWMLVYDTGETAYDLPAELAARSRETSHPIVVVRDQQARGHKIGKLRNDANQLASRADVLVHWDSDDWSAPERLEVQLQNVRQTGITSFMNMLFFKSDGWEHLDHKAHFGMAYEYDLAKCSPHNVIGTSLMYQRGIWESQPFNEFAQIGEDTEWSRRLSMTGVKAWRVEAVSNPRMIAEVHGGNSSYVYKLAFDDYQPAFRPEWRRAPEFDQFCWEKLYP